ncbi:MAG: tRNA 2-thiouridine(34) synthase MnmA, partial [Patescibacteria group bacterium]|nr:tRNA 2-thiouridine(34) synthase MnmA [Patescibacteria group bacterium]
AMSGGVDSSVAAALLKKKGYQVSGLFMRLWSDQTLKKKRYSKPQINTAADSARQAAAHLNIPLTLVDCRQSFRKTVVDYFLRELRAGRTPNPCVICNQLIKFDFLLKKAKSLGADFLATGHYVKLRRTKGKMELGRGRDLAKDQSYFLYTLTQTKLKQSLFPLGDLTKPRVRQIARNLKLPTADRAESNDICFIPAGRYSEFLKKYLKPRPGLIVSTKGEILGQHRGLAIYTVGQRSGLGIGGRGPFYVVRKDLKTNQLIVGKEDNRKLRVACFGVKKVNFISGKIPRLPLKCQVQVRYRQKATPATLKMRHQALIVVLAQAQRAVTPGQSAVFYQGKRLIGGGIII